MRARAPRILQQLTFVFVAVALLTPLLAQERSINPQLPVQAELITPLDAGRLHLGTIALAKVKYDWNVPGCKLRTGSTIIGHVANLQQRSKQDKGSSITLVFDKADCNEQHSAPLSLVLFAVVAEVATPQDTMQDRDGIFGAISARPAQYGGGSGSSSGPNMSSVHMTPNQDMSPSDRAAQSNNPKTALPGQVTGLDKVTLSVGTGTDGGSVLTSSKRNVRIERTTLLVLMPTTSLVKSTETSSASASTVVTGNNIDAGSGSLREIAEPPAPIPPPPPEPIDETEICSHNCTVADSYKVPANINNFATVSAERLGYLPHESREFTEFNYESTLTYLDTSKLLFTFDLHKLRQRDSRQNLSESTRTIRAVLIDSSTQTVERIVDWQVTGEGQYLWQAGSGCILVHTGHQLRLLDADLKAVHVLQLPGLLAWVATSPDGNRLAVGTVHERHTPALHQLILDSTHIDPEEDIDVQVLDHNLHLLLADRQPSTMYPPVLSNAGEILLHASDRDRWQISEYHWDGTKQLIATTTSRCHPTLSTPLSNYVFIVGCTKNSATSWYRMLRLDGHTILKNTGSSQEIEQSANSSNSHEFAIRTAHTFRSTLPGNPFHKADIKEQQVSVYETSEGRRLFTTAADDIPLTEQVFALSPNGQQLAVLRHSSIAFYQLGEATSPARNTAPAFQ